MLYDAPSFELVDQRGEAFRSESLRGEVWVANFFFTSCPSVCPVLMEKMARLQGRLSDVEGWRFVSFSVDPANDTPEVLQRYAQARDFDQATWTLLTGETQAVRTAVVEGMRVAMGERDELGDIMHASHFVLVDREGKVRGYYRSDDEGIADLERALRALL